MNMSFAGGSARSVASFDMSCFVESGSSCANALGAPVASRSSPTRKGFAVDDFRFMFALSSVHLEFNSVLMGVGDPLVLVPLHVRRGEDEIHEVHRLRPAANAYGQAVLARFRHLRRRNLVVCRAGGQRRDAGF